MDLVTLILACSIYPDNSITNAMVKLGSNGSPFTVTVHNNTQATTLTFKTAQDAIQYTQREIAQKHVVDLGIMQIPSPWLAHYNLTLAEVFRPCKNMLVASNILNHIADQCPDLNCTLSTFKSGDPQLGLSYATQIVNYAHAHPFVKPPSVFGKIQPTAKSLPVNKPENAEEELSQAAPQPTTAPTVEDAAQKS